VNVRDALARRKSVRAYLDRPVSVQQIERILDAARTAPSGANTQPWQVAVVQGETKRRIAEQMLARFQKGERGKLDYHYYPEHWVEPYSARRFACGQQLYTALGIERGERDKRLQQWGANYSGFGAPVMLFFFLDRHMEKGSLIDFGMFLQSLMLATVEEGMGCVCAGCTGGVP